MHPRPLDLIASAVSQSIKFYDQPQTPTRGPVPRTFDQSLAGGANVIGWLLLIAMTIFATPGEANVISGPAHAIDTTVIEVNGQRVMLFGIDSVMRKQSCTIGGKIWQCWTSAVRDLQTLLDQGPVTCEVIGEPDVYGRLLGRCTINGQGLNEQFVRRGYAVARLSETTEYVAAAAREEKVGLWRGEFMMPDKFRRAAGIFVERP